MTSGSLPPSSLRFPTSIAAREQEAVPAVAPAPTAELSGIDAFLVQGPPVLASVETAAVTLPAHATTPVSSDERAPSQTDLEARFRISMGNVQLRSEAVMMYGAASTVEEARDFMLGNPDSPVYIADEGARTAAYRSIIADVYNIDGGARTPPPVIFEPTPEFVANRAQAIDARQALGAEPVITRWREFGGTEQALTTGAPLGEFGGNHGQLYELTPGWTVASAALRANRDLILVLADGDPRRAEQIALAVAIVASVLNDSELFQPHGSGTGAQILVPNIAQGPAQDLFERLMALDPGERAEAVAHFRLGYLSDRILARLQLPDAHGFPSTAYGADALSEVLTVAAQGAVASETPMIVQAEGEPPESVRALLEPVKTSEAEEQARTRRGWLGASHGPQDVLPAALRPVDAREVAAEVRAAAGQADEVIAARAQFRADMDAELDAIGNNLDRNIVEARADTRRRVRTRGPASA